MRIDAVRERRWFLALLAIGAFARLIVLFADHGIVWPDEIYQSVEPAHKLAFGNGIFSFEFRDGLRSWFFPAQLAPALEIGSLLGAESGLGLVVWAKLAMVGYQLLAAWGAVRLGRALHGPHAGMLAGLLVIFLPIQILFGSRCMSEVASQTWIVWAAYHLVSSRPRAAMWVGLLLGGAIFVRYQNGVLVLAVLGVYALRQRWSDLGRFVLAGLLVAIVGGFLDLLTWGRFLHSFIAYVDFNFIHAGASTWGTSPWHFYVAKLAVVVGPIVVLLVLGHVVALGTRARAIRELVALEAVFLVAHMAIPHKEIRFLLPMMPLVAVVSAAGLCALAARRRMPAAIAAGTIVVAAAVCTVHAAALEQAEVGYGDLAPNAPAVSVWGQNDGLNRALSFAGSRTAACGVTVLGAPHWASGGYSYLHRNVPLLVGPSPVAFAASNVLVVVHPPRDLAPYRVRARFGSTVVAERPGGCAPIPSGYPRPFDR